MEVTRKNFKESLPLIRDSINRADFLVIDTEFTGLINGRDVCMLDSPEEYYTTLLNGSSEFMLIQYGLCAFYWDVATQRYKNEAYNFYLFPRGRPGPEKLFLCQSSSLDFLASQGFDFNKLIRDGISFMTEQTETKLRDMIIERHKASNQEQDTIIVPDEHKKYIEQVCTQIRTFLDEKKVDELEVDRCNAFVRRLLYQELRNRFKDEIYLETVVLENKDRILKVTRLTEENNEKNRDKLKKKKEWEEFEEAVGFSKVARMISQSEKLVIGHNMLLDVLHTLNHFFQPLKSMDYASFKEFTHCMFPKLLDTKYMSSLPPFKDKVNSSVLRHLFLTLSEDPFSIPTVDSDAGRGYSRADEKQHEAGYDAYVTGLCFLGMHAYLRRTERVVAAHSTLAPFLNKLFLARTAFADSPYINLNGADPTPSRDHVFHLTFPKEWQRNSISELFKSFGPITVQFLDDTTALVVLAKREYARYVLHAFDESNHVKVVPYVKYKRLTATVPHQQQMERLKQELERSRAVSAVEAPTTRNSYSRVGNDTSNTSKPSASPEKATRGRSSSMSSVSASANCTTAPTRKRTSSGVFQIDEVEPPHKKDKETDKLSTAVRSKDPGKADNNLDKVTVKSKNKVKEVITKFDSTNGDNKTKCVTAFKESDSWD